jgi:hypothetical protein
MSTRKWGLRGRVSVLGALGEDAMVGSPPLEILLLYGIELLSKPTSI